DGDDRQPAVLPYGVSDDEDEADDPREQPALELLGAQGRGDLFLRLHFERDRQGTETELLGHVRGFFASEVPGDLGLAVGDRTIVDSGGDRYEPIEHRGEAVRPIRSVLVVQARGHVAELLGSVLVEGDADGVVPGRGAG